LVPAVSSSEPIDIATPQQMVCTSGLMNCIMRRSPCRRR
jgi:hypothetical protein